MKEEKKKKISRDTVSLEKEGKKRKAEVLQYTENEEWDKEVEEYYARYNNVRGWELPYEDDVLSPQGTTK
jgi:hypothetical protein